MGNRCPDCNKFVSLEAQYPEVDNVEIDGTTITASVRLVLSCAECGTEMKEAYFELEGEVEGDLADHADVHPLSVEEGFCNVEDSYEYRGRKPLKEGQKVPFRFMTHVYEVALDVEVECDECDEGGKQTVTLTDSIPAGSFEDMN